MICHTDDDDMIDYAHEVLYLYVSIFFFHKHVNKYKI